MYKKVFAYVQYGLPQHFLSNLIGRLAETRITLIKNFLIKVFVKRYKVNLSEAQIEDPTTYPTFNAFFTRELKPTLRPIAQDKNIIISPADGTIAQLGLATQNRLLQAKNFYYDLKTLLAHDEQLTKTFSDGTFATFYLAPFNYHRVHMPLTGQLEKTIYVPGKLFSVNPTTTTYIPNIFTRNERLISVFNTEAGPMAVIMVGALIVGGIQTVWNADPSRENQKLEETIEQNVVLEKGAELGRFKLGSTVILLFSKQRISWLADIDLQKPILFGQAVGKIL